MIGLKNLLTKTIIFLAISNVCFAENPSFQTGFPVTLNGSAVTLSSPSLGDIDGDGDLEVVIGGGEQNGTVGTIYAWDFSGTTDDETPWPAFRRDKLNHGNIHQGIPLPAIKANSSDDSITINSADTLSLTISMDAGNSAGQSMDWWFVYTTDGSSFFYYDLSEGWTSGLSVSYQGGLI